MGFGVIAIATATLLLLIAGIRVVLLGVGRRDVWSIGIYHGPNLTRLAPHPAYESRPALRASDVCDASARFVADPFLMHQGDQWWMFLEVYNKSVRRGEIAVASSQDAVRWQYDRTVLKEPFHLSYPYVIEHGGAYFMIPESRQAGSVRLYRATAFPYDWRYERDLLKGDYADASIVHHGGVWWMFSQRDGDKLTLHHAEQLEGPWREHPASPLTCDADSSRPGGRIVRAHGRLIRFAQVDRPTYGRSLRAYEIVRISVSAYEEKELQERPLLNASGKGWNADGMHHLDVVQLAPDRWLAAVDGKRCVRHFNWRRGIRGALRLS